MNEIRTEMFKTWQSTWDGYLRTLSFMQEQNQKMLDLYFTQSRNFQTEAMKFFSTGMENAREAQSAYFKALDDNFKRFQSFGANK